MSSSQTAFDPIALARQLAEARKAGGRHPAASFAVPGDMPEVMATQAELARLMTGPVTAWKLGMRDGAAVIAPMYPCLRPDGVADWTFAAGTGLEPEVCFVLGADLPARFDPYSREEILATIDAIHFGLEVVGGRLAEGNKAPFPLFHADGMANDGYVLGPKVPDALAAAIRAGVASLEMPITFSGPAVEAKAYAGVHPFGDPLAPLVAYANAQTDQLGGLKAGDIITTGSFCGAPAVTGKGEATIDLDGTAVTIRFV